MAIFPRVVAPVAADDGQFLLDLQALDGPSYLSSVGSKRIPNATSPMADCVMYRNTTASDQLVQVKFVRTGGADLPLLISATWVDSQQGFASFPYHASAWPITNGQEVTILLKPAQTLYGNQFMTGPAGWVYWMVKTNRDGSLRPPAVAR